MYRQQEGQNFHHFVTELKKLSSECEFDNLQDSLIKNMIVCGTRDNSLCEKLLQECDLTLSKAINAGQAAWKHIRIPTKFSDLNLPPTLVRFLKRNSISLAITLATRTQKNL